MLNLEKATVLTHVKTIFMDKLDRYTSDKMNKMVSYSRVERILKDTINQVLKKECQE